MQPKRTILKERLSTYQKGLDLQRERFKAGKSSGQGEPDFDMMCDAIENIKSEIKPRMIKKGQEKMLKRIENIIRWYRTLEQKLMRPSPDGGYEIAAPRDLGQKINKNLTIAYELLVKQMDDLGLL